MNTLVAGAIVKPIQHMASVVTRHTAMQATAAFVTHNVVAVFIAGVIVAGGSVAGMVSVVNHSNNDPASQTQQGKPATKKTDPDAPTILVKDPGTGEIKAVSQNDIKKNPSLVNTVIKAPTEDDYKNAGVTPPLSQAIYDCIDNGSGSTPRYTVQLTDSSGIGINDSKYCNTITPVKANSGTQQQDGSGQSNQGTTIIIPPPDRGILFATYHLVSKTLGSIESLATDASGNTACNNYYPNFPTNGTSGSNTASSLGLDPSQSSPVVIASSQISSSVVSGAISYCYNKYFGHSGNSVLDPNYYIYWGPYITSAPIYPKGSIICAKYGGYTKDASTGVNILSNINAVSSTTAIDDSYCSTMSPAALNNAYNIPNTYPNF